MRNPLDPRGALRLCRQTMKYTDIALTGIFVALLAIIYQIQDLEPVRQADYDFWLNHPDRDAPGFPDVRKKMPVVTAPEGLRVYGEVNVDNESASRPLWVHPGE